MRGGVKMNIDFIGVPLFYGCDRKGVEKGPDKLREKSAIEVIRNHMEVYDLGNIYAPDACDEDKFICHSKMKYLQEIADINTNLAHQVYLSLHAGNFPLVIGGDHALGLGSISGVSKHFDNIAVVWIDAHGDINTPETSPSGNVHGMPLSAAMGVGYSTLRNLYFEGRKVKPKNVHIIGVRDLDEGEVMLAKEENINLYTMEEIKEKGLSAVLDKMIRKIKGSHVDAVHMSFDLDAMDGELVPGTGLPIPDGFTEDQVKDIFKSLLDTGLVSSMDLVELNPVLDKGDTTADLSIELIDYVVKTMKEKQ